MTKDGWAKVGGSDQKSEQWKAENAGDQVEGKYVDRRDGVKTNYGDATVYVLQKTDGSQVSVFGKPNINFQMNKVNLGEEVRITYLGLEKNPKSGFSFKRFEVEHRQPVASADLKGKDAVAPDDIPF